MAKISKYVKLNTDVLLEYIYNDENILSEPYNILINTKTLRRSYMAFNTSATNNIESNQLFVVDNITQKYSKVDTTYYSYLQLKEFSTSEPIRHDTIKIHLPINWTFGEHLGFYLKVFAFDKNNKYSYDLTNFYFDMTDLSQQYMLNYTTPAFLFQEKMWGKNIEINIPSVSVISAQTKNSIAIDNSINANLTNYDMLSVTSPIFIEFHFIDDIQTINSIKSYYLSSAITTTIPQTPEFETLGLKIEPSTNGDYFEIYGTYNNTKGGFNQWIEESYILGHRYYVEYNVTQYEQNIRGKTITFTQTDDFNESIDFRPIIKYSTSTAIIYVEMKIIDSIDNSYITRTASYGMLQDEVSKYALNLTKINLDNAYKPKIYNVRSSIDYSKVNLSNSFGKINGNDSKKTKNDYKTKTTIKTIELNYPVLTNMANIVGKSDNAYVGTNLFYGNSKMIIVLTPYDNIIKFTIANGSETAPDLMDLTSYGTIYLSFRDDSNEYKYSIYTNSKENNLNKGQIVFNIPKTDYNNIKTIYEKSNKNIFYIICENNNLTTVLYTGLFKMIDNAANIVDLNAQDDALASNIIKDPSFNNATAIVTRRLVNTSELTNTAKKSINVADLKKNSTTQLTTLSNDIISASEISSISLPLSKKNK